MGIEIRPFHVFLLLSTFLVVFLASEIRDYLDLKRFEREMLTFKSAGGRFTAQDGAALEARIKALEDRIADGQ